MADPKKMSVADILAAARKQGAVGGSPSPAEGAASSEPAAEPAESPPEAAKPEKPAAKPAAKPSGPMSVADILAAARAGKSGGDSADKEEEAAEAVPPAVKKPAEKKPAAAKPAGGAMSVSDILAAARAGKAGGESPTPATKAEKPAAKAAPAAKAEKPAVAKPAKEAAPAKGAAADKGGPVDTSSILAAARGGGKPGPVSKSEAAAKPAPEGKTKLTVPPMPEKPAYVMPRPAAVAAADDDDLSRRGFFGFFFGSFMATGFTTLALTHLLWLLGLARFMFPNILTEPPSKFRVGKKENFAPGMVENKFKAQFGVWIVNAEYEGEQQIFALRTVCTHLGCTPNWLEAEQKFKCPCHGSGFYKDGINFEGPAPRPLERYAVKLADDGQIEVDKSKLFFEEKGQWKDTASFVRA